MKQTVFAIRQNSRYGYRYCYYNGYDGEKHRWTKNLRNAYFFFDAISAFKLRDRLKYNNPTVLTVIKNGNNKIVMTLIQTRRSLGVGE
ncbi:MAG: hypothetical protein ACFFAU_01160 [Candidatus Hodarchaeota archaeon]